MARNSPVVAEVRKFREALMTRETGLMHRMVEEWRGVEKSLEASMDALALQIEKLQAAGQVVTPGKLFRMERYQRLLFEVRQETAKYSDTVAGMVADAQRTTGWIAEQEAQSLLKLSAEAEGRAGIALVQLRPDAVEGMVGLMADGTPLRQHLQAAYGDAAKGMSKYLVKAMGQGLNPRLTAAAMSKGLGIGLDRALVIARTEQMRVSREVHRLSYEASGQVVAYQRIAARQQRTCLGCLVADGRIYPIGKTFADHPNGRCTLVPILEGGSIHRWERGTAWFAAQSASVQRSMMGPTRYDLYESGAVRFEAMGKFTPNEKWGGSWGATPVHELQRAQRDAGHKTTAA